MFKSLAHLITAMETYGAVRFYAKKLSPNDNSKNQVYLGGDFSVLNIIPHSDISVNTESVAGSKRDRSNANIKFHWIDESGFYLAPNSKLILYPKYPEVRMSGFLKGCKNSPSHIMRSRDEGRILFLGIANDGNIYGFATNCEDTLTKELSAQISWQTNGVFIEIPPNANHQLDTKSQLLQKLTSIYQKKWITSQKMRVDGSIHPYAASNGGGYTLEAELGISPNGYAAPDYLDWEIKQYGVKDFVSFQAKSVVTLLTPEPTGGIYKDLGLEHFLHEFGYPDKKGRANRINFGGIYSLNKDFHKETRLKLVLNGYNPSKNTITDIQNGYIGLITKEGEIAAKWALKNILNHWVNKHAKAAYIPSMFRKPPPEYSFSNRVMLCEQTDFLLFLKAVSEGKVYYDPGVKMENIHSEKPLFHRRSQFRIRHKDLHMMYKHTDVVILKP